MKAWFGEQVDGGWKIAGRTPADLAAFAGRADSSGTTGCPDYASMAINAGLCDSTTDYLRLMHRTAIVLATSRIQSLLSSKDADIVQSIKALDTINDAFNELSERLTEWYGIHFPQYRARPQEVIAAVLKLATGDISAGAPLLPADLVALQSFARVAQT